MSSKQPPPPFLHTYRAGWRICHHGSFCHGILEAYRFSIENRFLQVAINTADGLLTALKSDGFLPARVQRDWSPSVSWACLTGTAQIAICWLILYQVTHEKRYRDGAYAANRYLRRFLCTDGPDDTRGAIKGSFPVNGYFGACEYLNWVCKFFIDSNFFESEIRARENKIYEIN